MQMKHILNCLPLVASVLSRKYGVNVIIGGDTAFTEGKNIHIPALSMASDEHLLCMVRGYTDHESAHIRFTDFSLMKQEAHDPVTFHIVNIIEDWRVERELTKLFAGSQVNLHYLIRHFFVDNKKEAGELSPAFLLLNYMLLTVRSWDIPEIIGCKGGLHALRTKIKPIFKGVVDDIDKIFFEIRANCQSTSDSIYYAKEIVKLLKNHTTELEQQAQPEETQEQRSENETEQTNEIGKEGASEQSDSSGEAESSLSALESLGQLFQVQAEDLPMDLGSLLVENLNQNSCDGNRQATVIGEIADCDLMQIPEHEKQNALRMSIALRARLQGFLQSSVRQENSMARYGKLHTRSLYRASIHNPKFFCREGIKKGINTAVHILLDVRGSMEGPPIEMARQVCFALGKVFSDIQGINPAITVFPAQHFGGDTLCPILRHGQKLTNVTVQRGAGSTPLVPALWWTMREMFFLKEARKIIFILTDGRPDNEDAAIDAIEKAEKLGFEVYGIGFKDKYIETLLPKSSVFIENLSDLVSATFNLLQKALLKS